MKNLQNFSELRAESQPSMLTVEAMAIIAVNTNVHSSNRFRKCFGLELGSLATSANAMSASTSKALMSELTSVTEEEMVLCVWGEEEEEVECCEFEDRVEFVRVIVVVELEARSEEEAGRSSRIRRGIVGSLKEFSIVLLMR